MKKKYRGIIYTIINITGLIYFWDSANIYTPILFGASTLLSLSLIYDAYKEAKVIHFDIETGGLEDKKDSTL